MKKNILFLLLLFCIPCFSQSKHVKVSLRNGASVEGVVKEFDPLNHITILVGDIESKIPMSQVAYVSDISNQEDAVKNDVDVEKVMVEVPDPLADYKGFLLAAGNNVYVYCTNSDSEYASTDDKYTNAAKSVLVGLLKKDGFWNVVEQMNDAHFTINYVVDTNGKDRTSFSVSSWRSNGRFLFGSSGGNENVNDNISRASIFYQKYIVPFQKRILKGTVSKKVVEDFTIK